MCAKSGCDVEINVNQDAHVKMANGDIFCVGCNPAL